MTIRLCRQTNVAFSRGGLKRRNFLKALPLAGLAAGAWSWTDRIAAAAQELRKNDMACILLWMQGGPSQFETFSPKPGHANGGETKTISTSVSGIEIGEHLPNVAKRMEDLCLIRSMTSKEGSHPRASYLMHTGYLPTATVKYPTLGSIVAKELGNAASELPSFVRIGGRFNDSAGLLGVDYDPFLMTAAGRLPDNTALPVSQRRFERRLGLLSRLEADYGAANSKQAADDHAKLYAQTARMITSPKMSAFDLEKEPQAVREAYGSGAFGKGCLLARRLVETGVTFVEVGLGNWDTHIDNADKTKDLCGQLDQPFAALLADLKERGRLDKTLVLWMGEFGRTPRINPRAGRDHYPRAFNVALAGGGVKGGQVIGTTSAGGDEVEDRPVSVNDLLRTICTALHINADKENMSNIGRPIKIVDGGSVVKEILS